MDTDLSTSLDEAAEKMSQSYIEDLENRLRKTKALISELDESQRNFAEQIQKENEQFMPFKLDDHKRIAKAFSKVPRYHKKVVDLSKRMRTVSQKILKMKQKARELLECEKR
mmetsp:Transcript_14289/g.34827  ORF Transcript_14289/g.34827 Transcript_14289/m.34827 type:complete len:112 (+) Transcript_14289:218-553(+)